MEEVSESVEAQLCLVKRTEVEDEVIAKGGVGEGVDPGRVRNLLLELGGVEQRGKGLREMREGEGSKAGGGRGRDDFGVGES